ncbi:MAG: DUF1559 domain-containing protein, partial [Thermoguttaceae bacterium]
LSLHNYHDTTSGFPSGHNTIVRPSNHTSAGSWGGYSPVVPLLPYFEMQALYDLCTTSNYAGWDPYATNQCNAAAAPAANASPWNQSKIAPLACPSDSYAIAATIARRTYVPSVGDWPDKSGQNDNQRGLFVLNNGMYRKFGSLIDGSSNTIAFSERIVSSGGNTVKGSVSNATDNGVDNTSGAGATDTVPLNCRNKIDSTNKKIYAGSTWNTELGVRWADGRAPSNFCTILAPNSANCQASAAATDYAGRFLTSASSFHSGGVNAGLADGSVRFVSETIDVGPMAAGTKPITSGQSPFGVWGALGSINGGESVSAP